MDKFDLASSDNVKVEDYKFENGDDEDDDKSAAIRTRVAVKLEMRSDDDE